MTNFTPLFTSTPDRYRGKPLVEIQHSPELVLLYAVVLATTSREVIKVVNHYLDIATYHYPLLQR
jgi:hypothetical protein